MKRPCEIVIATKASWLYATAWVKNGEEKIGDFDKEIYDIAALEKYGFKVGKAACCTNATATKTGLALKTENDLKQFKEDYGNKFTFTEVSEN